MSNFSQLKTDSSENDAIIDALLTEVAANQSNDDEAFLESIEVAINKADIAPMPSTSEKLPQRLLWSSGTAAALLIGIGVWFTGLQIDTIDQPIPAQIEASSYSVVTLDSVIESTKMAKPTLALPTVDNSSSAVKTIDLTGFSNSPNIGNTLAKLPESGAQSPVGSNQFYDDFVNGFDGSSLSGLSASTGSGGSNNSSSLFGQVHVESNAQTMDRVVRRTLPPYPDHPATTGLQSKLSESISKSQYNTLIDHPWASPLADPLSTFSTDVDTASWTNLRAMIRNGAALKFIPKDAVRIEEMINYFDWNYPQPRGEHSFSLTTEAAPCPWNPKHQLMRVGVQGKEIARTDRPAANLVFLLDVSGSMNEPNKLPLLKEAIAILVEELNAKDKVTIVVYAGSEGVALPPTSGRDQKSIIKALANLEAGGSTNGGAGIKLAYRLAKEQFIEEGINRVILCTDGDFNVGLTGTKELISLVEEKAKDGTYLSVLGFGQSNLNDAMLEEVTNRGNGNYFHIDGIKEARKVFLSDLMGTLVTIAKDVKIQVEFNPAKVAKYRLIGYANRKLAPEDFANDEIDAGEIGSGHTVTALYEIIPGKAQPEAPELRYQIDGAPAKAKELIPSEELALIKIRYKKPKEDKSILMTETILPPNMVDSLTSSDYHFVSAVALFGMILRDNEDVKDTTLQDVITLAESSIGPDPRGYRAEFLELVKRLSQN